MRFAVEDGPLEYQGRVVYRQKEWSFDFEPGQVSHCSVLIADLHLGFHTGTWHACQVSGFHPRLKQEIKTLTLPTYSSGSLILLDDVLNNGEHLKDVLEEIGSLRLDGSSTWPTLYDPQNGWICIGEENLQKGDSGIEFASNCIAVVNNCRLRALWMKPVLLE